MTLADSVLGALCAGSIPDEMTLFAKIVKTIARTIYCADGVDADPIDQGSALKAWEVAELLWPSSRLHGENTVQLHYQPQNSWRAHRLYHSGARSSTVGRSGIYCGHLWGHHDDAGPAEGAERRVIRVNQQGFVGVCPESVELPSSPCAWVKMAAKIIDGKTFIGCVVACTQVWDPVAGAQGKRS